MARPLPQLCPDALSGCQPRPAEPARLAALGLPANLPPDWRRRLLEAMGRALDQRPGLRRLLAQCRQCGACAGACPALAGSGDPRHTPQGRAELMRRVYRSHFSPWSRLRKAGWQLPDVVDEQLLGQWWAYFWQCTLCRRCAQLCPHGLDASLAAQAGREIMAGLGMLPATAARELARLGRCGNTLGLTSREWAEVMAGVEGELQAAAGVEIACPVDERRAEVLLIPAARDLTESRRTLWGYAALFHAAGVSWTTSSWLGEAGNPGLALGPAAARGVAGRALEAARELRPQYVLWGEDAQGWATARDQAAERAEEWTGVEWLKVKRPLHLVQFTHRLWREGAFAGRIEREANAGLSVVWHDPCHAARGAGLLAQPRALLAAVAPRLAELPPAVSGRFTRCCGAGGGLMAEGLGEARLAGARGRAADLDWARRERGATAVATMCADCQAGLRRGLVHFGAPLKVMGLHELWGRALFPALAGAGDA
ncbi:MAG: (Fe-S)-binding protein [Thermodesulfobacteriota bacterium]